MAQDAHDSLLSDWTDLWRQAGATPAPDLFARLMAAWSEPQRQYHTLQHLGECLAHFRALAHLPDHPVEVGFALFFHDAVYELGRPDNEARSADWARDELLAADLPADLAERVAALILATCHDAEPQGIDAQVLVDIDLAILGAAPARFAEYEAQVRREYGHLPDEVFRRGRMAILQQFRDRTCLFSTPDARERWETQARQNLTWSIQCLAEGEQG